MPRYGSLTPGEYEAIVVPLLLLQREDKQLVVIPEEIKFSW